MNSLDRLAKTLVEPLADKGTSPYETNATVIRLEDGMAWVQIPGGVEETPAVLAVSALPGDEVRVRVTGGKAYITGNPSAPPTDDTLAQKAQNEAVDAAKTADEAATQAEDANRTATGAARDASVAKETAESSYHIAANTNQYFWHTESGEDTGAHITEIPREAFLLDPEHGGGNLLARSNGIAVRDGLTETASFGASGSQIGLDDNTHIKMDFHSMQIVDTNDNTFFHVSDLRDSNGELEVTDTFEGDGNAAHFRLSYVPKNASQVVVTVNGATRVYGDDYEITDEDLYGSWIWFPAPDIKAVGEIVATYVTDSDFAKAYTLGIRTDPVGGMSVAEGIECVASETASHAEGRETTANSIYSHAEGCGTEASGGVCHAEGNQTTASGAYSHAEGNQTTASGAESHAEGYDTTASGWRAHAEGWDTTASGQVSHAEGEGTTASGDYSHAQNNGTHAATRAQTVIGEYNKIDTGGTAGSLGDYALIIGNGGNNALRSNALTVDWLGGVEMYLDHNGTASTDATSGTDKDLFNAIRALGWYSDVIV